MAKPFSCKKLWLGIAALLLVAYLILPLPPYELDIVAASQHGEDEAATKTHDSSHSRVLIVVLGHGQPERSQGLQTSLNFLVAQYSSHPADLDCMVFVWNSKMKVPKLPRKCTVSVKPGVFMTYLNDIPSSKLDAADYVWLMADDIVMSMPGQPPVNLPRLAELADANCLDVLAPAQAQGATYHVLKPHPEMAPGRFVRFIEWQAGLVSVNTLRMMARLTESNLTPCWGYDTMLWSALWKWTGRAPRLAVCDEMYIDDGVKTLTNLNASEAIGRYGGQQKIVKNPCGTTTVREDGTLALTALEWQHDFWFDRGIDVVKEYNEPISRGSLQQPSKASAGIFGRTCRSLSDPGSESRHKGFSDMSIKRFRDTSRLMKALLR
mmetsp:Transcript_52594/g.125610  ORF Transcript_52594/g.125610 Transcript_52594/m.125610 type:complete len:379 (-) Transcript_52594:94-1230(-)